MTQTQTQGTLPFEAPAGAAFEPMLRHGLPAEPGVWDELRHAGGDVRERWKRFASLLPLPPSGTDRAQDLEHRIVQVAQHRLESRTGRCLEGQRALRLGLGHIRTIAGRA